MKFTKVLIASAFFGTSFAAETRTATDAIETPAFKGNWTETFQTLAGPIIHTPTYMFMDTGLWTARCWGQMGFPAGVIISNEYRLPADLTLKLDSTREEFVEALQRARIYNATRIAAPTPASRQSAPVAAVPVAVAPKILAKQAAAARKIAAKRAREAKRSAEASRKIAARQAAMLKKIASKNAAIAKKIANRAKKKAAAERKKAAKRARV